MALEGQDILEALSGAIWDDPTGPFLVDVEGPDADCAEAAVRELYEGGSIKVWIQACSGEQYDFEVTLSDFERADADLVYRTGEPYQRNLLRTACYGVTEY